MRDGERGNIWPVAIVDDDDSFREAVIAHLATMGPVSHAFSDGASLLESEFLHHFCCILADYNMPGMDGVELHLRLTSIGITAPFVLMSSGLTEPLKVHALAQGVFDILEKPFRPERFLAVLARTKTF